MKVPITERAFLARVRRFFKAQDSYLKTVSPRWRSSLGAYLAVDLRTDVVEQAFVDLDALIEFAREEKILKPYETIAEAEEVENV